jgi:hypothetical protein
MTADLSAEPEAPAAPAIDAVAALQTVFGALNQIGMMVAELLSSRPTCVTCFTDRTAAQRAGVAEEKLPPLNVAMLILEGKGVCASHVRVGGGIILPGQG